MKSDFAVAVHTLVFLNHKGDYQSSERISENVCTNPVCIRRILSKLKKAGLVETKEGIDGGTALIEKAENINLAQVLKAVGDRPVSVSKKTGNVDMKCLIASNMGLIMDEIYEQMNNSAVEYLKSKTINSIDNIIFKED